jgi:hypothetical protein
MIRAGRLVAARTLDELRAEAPRRVTVTFCRPVDGVTPPLDRTAFVVREPQRWVMDVTGPLGPLVVSLGGLPIADISVAPFALEDVVLRFYEEEPPC